MILNFKKGWQILQDVHDAGEALGLYKEGFSPTVANQISEWEALPELRHLQLLFSDHPYYGRELRYFNQAPWWYRLEFEVPADAGSYAMLRFTNVDYYCRIWLNGEFVGEHEGYSMPFGFRVDDRIIPGKKNVLMVKVWSPWDDRILNDAQDRRTFLVLRNTVKGTYEHSDGFIQRDVNPVGIYGEVTLELCGAACLADAPEIDYTLSGDLKDARITAKAAVVNVDGGDYALRLTCTDRQTMERILVSEIPVEASGDYVIEADAKDIHLWNTWDKGGVWLYDMKVELVKDGAAIQTHAESTGFRKIEMVRNEEITRFYLNGRAFYVRGTSYFPDIYVSNMCYERYKRDLLGIRAAGFNLVRIHVHVDQPIFYQLCSEIGIAVMQDSEYNWMHPADDAYAERFIRVYLDTVRLLKRYCAMFCWICMNEPGMEDPMGRTTGRAMTVNPGPRLYQLVHELDPSRPIIKGSYCDDDPTSGDSHNYTASLNAPGGHYTDIYGTVEKYNTEFGFDAPGCVFGLRKCPPAMKRLSPIEDRLDEIQKYQYKLLKYYTEHYRLQKYAPNSGYVQFLYNDLCPQSFYGIFDYWGLPKAGLDAMLESNMPVGVFLKYSADHIDGIWAVNDDPEALGEVQVKYVFTDENGDTVSSAVRTVPLEADAIARVCDIDIKAGDYKRLNCALILMKGGKVISTNHYEDIFNIMDHVEGHPLNISHEIGMRYFFA